MDAARFDALARSLTTTRSRRSVARLFGGLSLGGVLTALRIPEVAAGSRLGGAPCSKNSQCAAGKCFASGKCSCSSTVGCKAPLNPCKTATCDAGTKHCQTTNNTAQCSGGTCQGGVCTPSGGGACNDNVKNGDETDVDCGGSCDKCRDGRTCKLKTDCLSGVCEGGTCSAASCRDAVKNGDETDVDCGGTSCSPCFDGQGCSTGTDCRSGSCVGGVCQVPPKCAPGQDLCVQGATGNSCTDRLGCFCYTAVNGVAFCGRDAACSSCTTDADCTAVKGEGSACLSSGPACATCPPPSNNNLCAAPC